ncbi:MAG: tetratricopeptide repeat protein [Mariprofundaceae bacterium]|nr:tetratricopeptide repeat protein [Mariprofundaceae bacterium]
MFKIASLLHGFPLVFMLLLLGMHTADAVGNLNYNPDKQYAEVWRVFYQDDYGQAKELAKKIIQQKTGVEIANAYYILARIYERESDFKRALEHYDLFLAYRKKAVFSIHASRKRKMIRSAIKHDNTKALTHFLAALEERNKGRMKRAIKICRQLVQEDPKNRLADDALHMIANIMLMDQRDENAAIAAYQELIERYPYSNYRDHAEFGLGMALEGANQFEKAKLSYGKLRDRHLNIKLFGSLALVKDSFQSRYWHKRASDRLVYLQEHAKLYQQGKQILANHTILTSIGDRFQYQLYDDREHMRDLWKIVPDYGFKSTSLTHWITRSTRWKWESPQRLQACHRAGFTPVISYWYFGDEITPQYVQENKEKYFEDIRTHLIPYLQSVPEVIVLLEPEFNKNGIESWPEWSNVASKAIQMIKEAVPGVHIGLVLGNWSGADSEKFHDFIRPVVEISDFVGFQDMVSTFESPIMFDPAHDPAQRSIQLAKSLSEAFHKPLYIGYLAFSSYRGWGEKQASFLHQIKKNMPIYAALGVFGIGYFSLFDDREHHGWFSEAEYHFGLLKVDGKEKPAAAVWKELETDIRVQNTSELVLEKSISINRHDMDFAKDSHLLIEADFDQWARWALRVVGKESHAIWRTYGAGHHVHAAWNGISDIGFFKNEEIVIELAAYNVNGKRLAQRTASVVQLKNIPTLKGMHAVELIQNETVFAWGDALLVAEKSKRALAMQLEFNTISSGIVIRLAGKKTLNVEKVLAESVISMDFRLDKHGAEGLRIGIQDENGIKIHVNAGAYVHPDTAAGQWQRIHIPLNDFVQRAALSDHKPAFNWKKVRKLSLGTAHAPYVMQFDRLQLQQWQFYKPVDANL